MVLTLFAIQKAKPRDKLYKLADGNGLFLLINPNGKKQWRFRYRFAGKENMLAFGTFPEISLASARKKRDEARSLVAEGIEPSLKRKADKIAAANASRNTLGAIASEYLDHLRENGRAVTTMEKNTWLLNDLAAPFRDRPIKDINAAEILALLRKVEKTGRRETAQRLRGTLGSVFRYAIATLRAEHDPTFALRGALLKPIVIHRPAITDEKKFGALLLAIEEYDGWPTIRAAVKFLALTMTRPGDVRFMRRSEVNFVKATWSIPAERMKMRRPHDVPLATQALDVLQDVWELSQADGYVFPAIRSLSKPLSEVAMNSALRRLGYAKDEMTAHGFRSSASTILNERGFNPDVIEAALAHQDQNSIRRACNRATYWPERVKLMQSWADMLDEFKRLAVASGRTA
jgi:integrase